MERRNKNMAVLKRSDLIKMISKKIYGRYPQEEIYWILKGFAECLEEILKNGDTLKLSDCFTMEPKYRRERKLNNLDNETIVLPAQYQPNFRPYKKLKEACSSLPVDKELDKKEGKENEA